MASFLPSREADLVTWSNNFSTLINATPTDFGLSAPQAANYSTLNDAFVAAYQVANDPSTRTPSAIVAKDTAKKALKDNARVLAALVQAYPSITAEQITDLGLTVRDTEGTPIPPPAEAPILEINDRIGTRVQIKLHDGSGSRRGRPEGVQGASVFSFIGAAPPVDVHGWHFEGNTTLTIIDVDFPVATEPGTTVWLTAFWYNPRGQSGPGCAPVSTFIAGGAMSEAA